MLNKLLTLRGKAIVALACVGLLAPAAVQAEPQQPTGKPELISPERAAMVEEMLTIVEELTKTLTEVRDAASADVAAGKVYDLNTRIIELSKRTIQHPIQTWAEQQALAKVYGKRVDESFRKLERLALSLKSKSFYKSKPLAYALTGGMAHKYFEPHDNSEGMSDTKNFKYRADVEKLYAEEFANKTDRPILHEREYSPMIEKERLFERERGQGTISAYGNRFNARGAESATVSEEEYKKNK